MRIAVTGGATGIGRQVVELIQAKGGQVTVFDIVTPDYKVDEYIPLDLSKSDSIKAALSQVKGAYDALCNVAGLPPREGNAVLGLKVNFIGTREFTEGMLAHLSEGSSIVNVASRAGAMWKDNIEQVKQLMALSEKDDVAVFCEQNQIDYVRAYNLSKEAVIVWGMAECEALLQRGIRINSVSPAAIETGILQDFKNAFGEKTLKNIQRVGRAGLPSEVASIIIFLISPQSNWLKGIDINVDGGMTACNLTDALEIPKRLPVSSL